MLVRQRAEKEPQEQPPLDHSGIWYGYSDVNLLSVMESKGSTPKPKLPQMAFNERFHKTIMKEFYQVDLPEIDLLIYRGAADRAGGWHNKIPIE